jgi:arginyl-tRNA synthetase
VLSEDAELSVARLALARAAKIVLASALGLVGVSAPEAMEREPAPP